MPTLLIVGATPVLTRLSLQEDDRYFEGGVAVAPDGRLLIVMIGHALNAPEGDRIDALPIDRFSAKLVALLQEKHPEAVRPESDTDHLLLVRWGPRRISRSEAAWTRKVGTTSQAH